MINTKNGKTTQVTILSCRLPSRMDNPLAATYLNINTNQTQVYLVPGTSTKFIENPHSKMVRRRMGVGGTATTFIGGWATTLTT